MEVITKNVKAACYIANFVVSGYIISFGGFTTNLKVVRHIANFAVPVCCTEV